MTLPILAAPDGATDSESPSGIISSWVTGTAKEGLFALA
jgi:hypothetical protein